MPNKDKTGPEGKGARTGRQQGDCKDAELNEDRPRRGLSLGDGRGLGRGFRNR